MRFMLLMKSTPEAAEAFKDVPFEQVIEAMGRYNDELTQAGVLLSGEGLADISEAVTVDFDSEPPVVTDGPFAEAKELFNGYWIVQAASREEAVEWAKKAPLGPGSWLEVRRVNEIEDFPQDHESIQREAQWRATHQA